jgi:acylphosphatase
VADLAALSAMVHGRVQGVNFRYFVLRQARALSLSGYARNLEDGRTVEVRAEGERARLEELLAQLKVGPSRAQVETVDVHWSEYTGGFHSFEVAF